MSRIRRTVAIMFVVVAALSSMTSSASAGGTTCSTNIELGATGNIGDGFVRFVPFHAPEAQVITLDSSGCAVLVPDKSAVVIRLIWTSHGRAYAWKANSTTTVVGGSLSLVNRYDSKQSADIAFYSNSGRLYAYQLPRFYRNGAMVRGRVTQIYVAFHDARYEAPEAYPTAP